MNNKKKVIGIIVLVAILAIGIGYADGLPRNVSNNYYVHIGNEKAKIVGNICIRKLLVCSKYN